MKDILTSLTSIIPFLQPYPFWVKVVVAIWVVATALMIVALIFFPPSIEEPPANELPTFNNTGDVAFSQNQSGGQTANTIVNKIPPARTIKHAREKIIAALKTVEPQVYSIEVLAHDREAVNLANEIKEAMHAAGWTDGDVRRGIGGTYPPGFMVSRHEPSKASEVIVMALYNSGLYGGMWDELRGDKIKIYIGTHPDTYTGGFKPLLRMERREFR